MVRELDEKTSKTVGDNHEKDDKQPAKEKDMDLHNNQVGRDLAKNEGSCLGNARGALAEGQLKVIEP